MYDISTADLWDQYSARLKCADPIFCSFGKRKKFAGEIVTIQLFEDNSYVRKLLETPGRERTLVVDGGGSLRCALLGDQLAGLAIQNGWSGLVINGCIRDSALIRHMEIGVMALNTCPVKSKKNNEGQVDIALHFAGIDFVPGHFLYADQDGLLVSEDWLEP